MHFGRCLITARKRNGLSQEQVAAHLGVSRQTISQWEQEASIPNLLEAQQLSMLYGIPLEALLEPPSPQQQAEAAIAAIDDKTQQEVDWTQAWATKYPILATYQEQVDLPTYAVPLKKLLSRLRVNYHYTDEEALLVLKDILATVWQHPDEF